MKRNIDDEIVKNVDFDVIIIDAMNIVFRYMWTMRNLINSKGEKTGLYYGILNFLHYLKEKYHHSKIIFVWDTKPTKKKSICSSYKANRVHDYKDDFWKQIRKLKILLSLYGIYQFYYDGLEADDVAAKIVRDNIKKNILLISKDNDWFYLLKNDNVYIMKDDKVLNRKDIEKLKNINVEKQLLFKAILGDKKDNVIGISRIPKAFVWSLLSSCENIDDVFKLCINHEGRWYNEIINNKDNIIKNYNLVRFYDKGYKLSKIDIKKNKRKLLLKLKQLEMYRLYERIENE